MLKNWLREVPSLYGIHPQVIECSLACYHPKEVKKPHIKQKWTFTSVMQVIYLYFWNKYDNQHCNPTSKYGWYHVTLMCTFFVSLTIKQVKLFLIKLCTWWQIGNCLTPFLDEFDKQIKPTHLEWVIYFDIVMICVIKYIKNCLK